MRRTWFVLIVALISVMTGPTVAHAQEFGPPGACGPGLRGACLHWVMADAWAGHHASVEVLHFYPAGQGRTLATAAWIRSSSTDLALYPGYEGPGATTLARGPEMVPSTADNRLLATFNSGFYESDLEGGFYTNSTLYFPLRRGLATILRYRDGGVGLVSWSGGARPPGSVVMARQNLPLLVSGGRPNPLVANNSLWGLTLYGAPAVWRSALGIDAHGNVIYAAAPAQTAASMANIMVQLHCVRAMELDINPEWPIFVTYGARGAGAPLLQVPNPNQIPGRFLYPSTKDFFAVFVSIHPGEAQPW
jgi:hypothetical protein